MDIIEQEFIDKMNDENIREKVCSNFSSENKHTYIGTFYIANKRDYKFFKDIQPLTYTEKAFQKILKKRVKNNTFFTVAGCEKIFNTDYCHFMGFLYENKKLYGFCAGSSMFNSGMIEIVSESIKKALNIDIEWDGGSPVGPQNYTNSLLPYFSFSDFNVYDLIPQYFKRTDSFCQTWVLLWLKDRMNNVNFTWLDWSRSKRPAEFTNVIRKFILEIQNEHKLLNEEDEKEMKKNYA